MELVFSPVWFYGKDIIIDLISVSVLFLIALFSVKYYRMNKENKNHLLLATSFIIIAVSFLFKIIMNFTIYYTGLEAKQLGNITLIYTAMKQTDLLFTAGFLMHRVLMLLGLYMLCSIYLKQNRTTIFLVTYLIVISTYFSWSAYFIFHLTALILLLIITLNYLSNYRKTGHYTIKWLTYSFILITISQMIFMFISICPLMYVIAEVVQLAGYVGLLITFIKVIKYGQKKGKK